jgi:hypothetical protein
MILRQSPALLGVRCNGPAAYLCLFCWLPARPPSGRESPAAQLDRLRTVNDATEPAGSPGTPLRCFDCSLLVPSSCHTMATRPSSASMSSGGSGGHRTRRRQASPAWSSRPMGPRWTGPGAFCGDASRSHSPSMRMARCAQFGMPAHTSWCCANNPMVSGASLIGCGTIRWRSRTKRVGGLTQPATRD